MPSQSKLILDFDGTLVKENSARVFEAVTLRHHGRLKTKAISVVYFGPLRKHVDRIFGGLARVFYGGKDLRLATFLVLSKKVLAARHQEITEKTATILSMNSDLVQMFGVKDGPVIILSCGLRPIIEEFLRRNEIDGEVRMASSVRIGANKLKFNIMAPAHKLGFLEKGNEFEKTLYLTDDHKEAQMLSKKIGNKTTIERLEIGGQDIFCINID